jgi:hypothetical protein
MQRRADAFRVIQIAGGQVILSYKPLKAARNE